MWGQLSKHWKIFVNHESWSLEMSFHKKEEISYKSLMSAINEKFKLSATDSDKQQQIRLETTTNSGENIVIISDDVSLLSAFDKTSLQCKITVRVLKMPFILVKLVDDKQSEKKVNKWFKWRPRHSMKNQDNNEDKEEKEREVSVSINWGLEFSDLVHDIQDNFNVSVSNGYKIIQVTDEDDYDFAFDGDALECAWDEVLENESTDKLVTLQVRKSSIATKVCSLCMIFTVCFFVYCFFHFYFLMF